MKKITIIDDSATVLKILKKCLVNSGYEVETIIDSGKAFDGRLQAFNPDLVIIDINMPEFDGFYVLEKLKKNNLCPNAKILMCSSKFFEHDIARAKELGADDFLVKPFSDNKLIEKVSSLAG